MASPGATNLGHRQEQIRFNHGISGRRPVHRTVIAAVCYRILRHGKIEFLLVRTGSGRWTFPKGGVANDSSFAAAAAREAYEEAGVTGHVDRSCLTRYLHRKNGWGTQVVHAHLCEVTHMGPSSEVHRAPTWFSPESAKERLRESRPTFFGDELGQVVDAAVRHLKQS